MTRSTRPGVAPPCSIVFLGLSSQELTPPERRFGSSPAVGDLGHRLIRAHPNSEGGELDGGEEVVVAFVVSRGDGSEMLEFVEEAFDGVALFVDSPVETEGDHPPRHRLDLTAR